MLTKLIGLTILTTVAVAMPATADKLDDIDSRLFDMNVQLYELRQQQEERQRLEIYDDPAAACLYVTRRAYPRLTQMQHIEICRRTLYGTGQ